MSDANDILGLDGGHRPGGSFGAGSFAPGAEASFSGGQFPGNVVEMSRGRFGDVTSLIQNSELKKCNWNI